MKRRVAWRTVGEHEASNMQQAEINQRMHSIQEYSPRHRPLLTLPHAASVHMSIPQSTVKTRSIVQHAAATRPSLL